MRYFLRLGTIGFGGPIALVGYMQRDLVDRLGWISQAEYTEGLALAQLAPGPLAAQLAIYLGWVRGRTQGALLVALAFVGPSFVMVVGLSALYLHLGGLAWMRGAFYGVGAAVIAIIVRSAVKLVRMTLGRDRLLWAAFLLNGAVTAWTASEILWLFVLSGIAVAVVRGIRTGAPGAGRTLAIALPPWLLAGVAGPASWSLLAQVGWFFAKAGAVVFGSGLAIVPFLYGGVVERFHWLSDQQFLDAVAVSMITPGPVVITVAFIGYLTAGPLGAVVAALGVFLPAFLVVVVLAPSFHRVAGDPRVTGFVAGVTAAATGTIAGAAFVLGRRAITDITTALIAMATLAVLLGPRKAPEPLVIVAAGVVGILLHTA